MGRIRVLLCDASAPYRRLIEIMVDQHSDLELIATASDQAAAIDAAERLDPDVVLLDALLPGRPAMGAIRAAAPGATVLILSSLDNTDNPLRDAADGFVLKTRPLDEIARAIRDAAGPVAADAQPVYGRGAGADSAIATIRKVYAAFARRDLGAALEYTSADFELMPSGTAALIGRNQPYLGHAGVRQYFADAEALWQDIQIDAHDFRATGGGVIVFGQVEGTAAGERIRRQVVWIWQVVDGKATSMRVTDVGDVTPAD
jgi:ketosteroid isomerase-like protein/CheY-like chemotaxis protein